MLVPPKLAAPQTSAAAWFCWGVQLLPLDQLLAVEDELVLVFIMKLVTKSSGVKRCWKVLWFTSLPILSLKIDFY